MPKASLMQNAFNGGQFGPRVQGRTDLARYRTGCQVLRNFIPTVQGPAVKRSGTRFVRHAKFSDQRSRLIRFEFSRDQAYVLEFADLVMRVYRDSGAVLADSAASNTISNASAANPVVILTAANHGLIDGDYVFISGCDQTELNGRWFLVNELTATTYELVGEDGTGRSTGTTGNAQPQYEIVSPYTEAQLDDIQIAQSQDVLYLAHPDVPPQKVSRTSDTGWTFEEIAFKAPPFRAENLTDTTVSANASTGATITLTASADLFAATDVGKKFKFREVPAEKYPKWQADQTSVNDWVSGGVFAVGATSPNYQRCYFENNVYKVTDLTAADTGTDPPIHIEAVEEFDRRVGWTFINSGWGYGEITGYTNPTTVTLDVDTDGIELPVSIDTSTHSDGAGAATKNWSFGAWDDTSGYPRAVAFFENRLWWAGTTADPQTFWGSRTGQYEDHTSIPDEADSAVQFTLASDKINAIEWMSGDDQLFIGTRGSEYTADSGSATEAITPSNIRVRRRSNYGSASGIQPLTVDSAILFMHRSKRRLHELIAEFDSDLKYLAPDLTDLSYDILQAGVVDIAYQASPFRQVWALLEDGTLSALTYVRDEDVVGWSVHTLGGTDTQVESIAVIPHPDEDEDQLWMIVARTIDGATARYVEILEKPFESDDDPWDAFFVDSGLSLEPSSVLTVASLILFPGIPSNSYTFPSAHGLTTGDHVQVLTNPNGANPTGTVFVVDVTTSTQFGLQNLSSVYDNLNLPAAGATLALAVNTVSNLEHLEGESVAVLGSGIDLGPLTVSSGAITLPSYAAYVHVGLAQPEARLQTMRLDTAIESGTGQGLRKRIPNLIVRVDNTGPGLKFGADFGGPMDEWLLPWRDATDLIHVLETRDTESLDMPSGWEREGRVAVSHAKPHPCTVVALMPQVDTKARG